MPGMQEVCKSWQLLLHHFFGVKLQGLCWLGFWERGSQERDDGQDIPDGHLPMTVVHVISDVKLLQWSKWLQMDRGFSTAAKWVSLNFFKIFFFFWHGLFLKSLLSLLQYCCCCMFWFFDLEACLILALWQGIKPTPSAPPVLEG